MDFQLVRVTITLPSSETTQAEGMVVQLNPATGQHLALTEDANPQAFPFTRQSIIAWQPRRVYREMIDDHNFDKYEFRYK